MCVALVIGLTLLPTPLSAAAPDAGERAPDAHAAAEGDLPIAPCAAFDLDQAEHVESFDFSAMLRGEQTHPAAAAACVTAVNGAVLAGHPAMLEDVPRSRASHVW